MSPLPFVKGAIRDNERHWSNRVNDMRLIGTKREQVKGEEVKGEQVNR